MALNQTYLDRITEKTGVELNDFLRLAQEKGFDTPETMPGAIIAWLKEDYDLGHGYALALTHFIKAGKPRTINIALRFSRSSGAVTNGGIKTSIEQAWISQDCQENGHFVLY